MRQSAGSPDGMSIDTKKGDRCISLGLSPRRKHAIGRRYIHTRAAPRCRVRFSTLQAAEHWPRWPASIRSIGSAAAAVANNLSARSHNVPTTTANPAGFGGAARGPREWVGRTNGWFAACGHFSEVEFLVLLSLLLRETGGTWLI